MKIKLLILFLAFAVFSFAQDVDVYHKNVNDNFHFPQRPMKMDFEEFELLSTQIRMQDIFAAWVVPGYIHFVIKEQKKGWYLLGLRSLGYSGILYLALRNKSIVNVLFNPLNQYTNETYTGDLIVSYVSTFLIVGTFLYDWIHGRYLLHHKQNKIRFKYSPVIGWTQNPSNGFSKQGVTFGIRINF